MQNRDVRALMAEHGHRISPWTLRRIPLTQLRYTITAGGKTGKGHRRYDEKDVIKYLESRHPGELSARSQTPSSEVRSA